MAMSTGFRTITRTISRKRWPTLTIRCASTAAAVDTNESLPYVANDTPPLDHAQSSSRRQAIRQAKPFSEFLTDNFNRQHDYLRISVTERCNLRCLYCMPEEGIQLSPSRDLVTSAEIYYLSALFVNQGVSKIRLTGGEPTVRKDIVPLMQQIGSLRRNGLKELALTTNGISLHRKLDAMVEAGLTGVNISLDTLDSHQFQILTRRQGFDAVMKSITRVQEMNKLGAGVKLKINCVVMRGLNDHQILSFVDMTRDQDVEVRFIEYMPFGGNKWSQKKMLSYEEMLDLIRVKYPTISRLRDAKNDTSKTWQVPGHKGRIGFITSMTHNFCGTCNRLRITGDGNLKVCLHGNAEVSLRDLLRAERNGEPMDEAAFDAIRQIELDRRKQDSTEGWITKERQLLDVIGTAVKRKAARHAGMENLENMENRPMILIGGLTPPWARIPIHLLNPASSIPSGIRCYSSDSQDNSDRDKEPNEKERRLSFVSSLGFQSLSTLFSPPPQTRYSRPPAESDVRSPALAVKQDDVPAESRDTSNEEKENKIDLSFFNTQLFKPADEGMSKTRQAKKTSVTTEIPSRGPDTTGRHSTDEFNEPLSTAERNPINIKKHKLRPPVRDQSTQMRPPAREKLEKQSQEVENPFIPKAADEKPSKEIGNRRVSARRQRTAGMAKIVPARAGPVMRTPSGFRPGVLLNQDRKRLSPSRSPAVAPHAPNPFAGDDLLYRSVFRPETGAVQGEKPWGLDNKELKPAEMSVNEAYTKTEAVTPPGWEQLQITAKSDDKVKRRSRALEQQEQLQQAKADLSHDNEGRSKLTHLKSSGEAHMVDVGEKAATKRIAIAYSCVRFSSQQALEQIQQNNNKKGDVLSVARIAAIMAAKRTADLVPLCHPIALSKVEVECNMIAPGQISSLGSKMKAGAVEIFARVECTASTGVEMEALTAAMTGSLTVYDMCKAVDKAMRISQNRLIYKSGGRSGLLVDKPWLVQMGGNWTKFFEERGLQVPEFKAMARQSHVYLEAGKAGGRMEEAGTES